MDGVRNRSKIVLLLINIASACFFSADVVAAQKYTPPVYKDYPSSNSRFNMGMLLPAETDVGFLLGYTVNSQSGTTNSTVFSNTPVVTASSSAHNAQRNGDVGLQLKLVYDLYGVAQPFLYLNALSVFGSSNTLNMGFLNATSTGASQLVRSNDWLARLGIGVQTEPFFGDFQLGAGFGAVLVNQKLKAFITEANTTIFQNQSMSIAPTFMGSLTWRVCKSCISDRPLSLSLQVSFDSNPRIGVNGVTPSGNVYNSSLSQKWIPHGDLVLNIPWF